MTDLQKTQAAYAHFTLDEWKTIAHAVAFSSIADSEKVAILAKMPSAALPDFGQG